MRQSAEEQVKFTYLSCSESFVRILGEVGCQVHKKNKNKNKKQPEVNHLPSQEYMAPDS